MTFITFEDADAIVNDLIAALDATGITPAIGAPIEGEMLSPLQLLEATRNLTAIADDPALLADAGGMYDLAAKILSVVNQPEFATFAPHLKLFEAGQEFATAVQPKQADVRDEVNRKLTELYLGTLAVHFAHDVRLDHPVRSKGDNPDILFDIEVDGSSRSTWAMAIKTVSSRAGQTIFENVAKAAAQIDARSCPANRGIVVINLKNALRHNILATRIYANLEDAQAAMRAEFDVLIAAMKQDRPDSDWERVFASRTSPEILFIAHAVVQIRLPGDRVVPTILKMARLENPVGKTDTVATHIAAFMNHWMQAILRGRPGSAGVHPS